MNGEDCITLALILIAEFLLIFQAVNTYLAYEGGDPETSLWHPVLWVMSSIIWGGFTIFMAREMNR